MPEYFNDIPWHENTHVPAQNLTEANFRITLAGWDFPHVENACELGFGQGASIVANAAARPDINWVGTDFNQNHVEFANAMRSPSCKNADLRCQSFSEFADSKTPQFDFVSMFGCWSWISDEALNDVLKFLQEKLKPGGVFVCNYLTHPGQAQFAAFREFVLDCADIDWANGQQNLQRVEQALQHMDAVMNQNPWYLRANPDIADFIKKHMSRPTEYFLHEYLNVNWNPMSFANVTRKLHSRDLQFACASDFLEEFEELHIDPRQVDFLASIDDPILRETSKDFIRLTKSRTDFWIKSPKKLPDEERAKRLAATRFTAIDEPNSFNGNISGTLGPMSFEPSLCAALLSQLKGSAPTSITDLQRSVPEANSMNTVELAKIMGVLVCGGLVAPVLDERQKSKSAEQSAKEHNQHLLQNARLENITTFASPVTGSAYSIPALDKAFIRQGGTSSDVVDTVVALECKENFSPLSRSQVQERSNEFIRFRHGIYKSLGIC